MSIAAPPVAVHPSEGVLFLTLLQLTVIVLAGRIGGEAAKRIRQSAAVGEIVLGILLGPSLFGQAAPELFHYVFRSSPAEPLQILSQLGLVLLMFQIGLEFDFSHLGERRNRALVVRLAAVNLILPFLLGLIFGFYSAPMLSPQADPLASALFIATAFSITALPILGRIMIEFNMTRLPLGVIAISVAAINDVIGWLLLALVTALTVSAFDMGRFAAKLALVGGFILASGFLIRPLLKRWLRYLSRDGGGFSNNLLASVLVGIFLAAMVTYQLGIFAIFGGFMMGVILYDEHPLAEAWKERVGHFVTVFFLPIFFTYTGLRTNIGGLDSIAAWGWCALIVFLATLGKFGGTYCVARVSRLDHYASCVLGIMMNTRALMELIVINVGYDLGVISQQVFTMLVIMAIVSTIATTPCLRAWLPRARPSVAVAQTLGEK